jgi:hypothetical protein
MQSKFTEIDQLAATTLRMLAADGVQQLTPVILVYR